MILVTGGTGYIGSHVCVALAQAGFDTVLIDNFSNSKPSVLDRLGQILGKSPTFIQGDIRDSEFLNKILLKYPINSVMHFAGLKAVADSVLKPLEYYDNNVRGSITLLDAMKHRNIKTFVFSSSATVYGNQAVVPVKEDALRSVTNPYGHSKLIVEDILSDLHLAEPEWNIARLRYFNPVGAHDSGLIGEDPIGIPNNLMPVMAQVAAGRLKKLLIYGGDYATPDGTGIRDYIHVMDLAEGHVAALTYVKENGGLLTANLGTGTGCSVLQLLKTFEEVSKRKIPYEFVPRRKGDVAQCWADSTYATSQLQWHAKRDIHKMCFDSWHWQQANWIG